MPKLITNGVLAEKIDNLTILLKAHIQSDEHSFDNLNEFIDGNGKPGLKTRMDRIEQLETGRRWHVRSLWATLIASCIGLVFKIIFG